MRKFIWGLLIAALAMIFALQNADKVPVHFFLWKTENTSLALILLCTFMLGMLAGVLLLTPKLLKQQKPTNPNKRQGANL